MAFRCSSCNGSMVFDIESQMMKCGHCGTVCSPEEFLLRDVSTGAAVQPADERCPHCTGEITDADRESGECPYCGSVLRSSTTPESGAMARYACENCGAELESTDDSLIGLCPYCGGQSLLKSDDKAGNPAERLIPFQITREKCGELYQKYTKNILYLPGELRNPEHLRDFTGIYMPYYEYDAVFGTPNLVGEKTVEKNSSYDVVNTYEIPVEIEGGYQWGTPFDSSRYLDDGISSRIMPFNAAKEREFHPGYLAGFYADCSTVPPEIYNSDAQAQAEKDMLGEIGARWCPICRWICGGLHWDVQDLRWASFSCWNFCSNRRRR